MSESEFKKIVGKNIEKLINSKGLTQSQFAEIIGVSESTVGKWILEKSAPRAGIIDKISQIFDIPKSELVTETTSENKAIKTIAAHLENADVDLDDESIKDINNYIDFVIAKVRNKK